MATKKLTFSPKAITDGSSFTGILTGSDYRTVSHNGGSWSNIGIVGFDTTNLRNLSAACVFKAYKATYEHKGGNGVPGAWTYWRLTPYYLTDYSVSGTSLSISAKTQMGTLRPKSQQNASEYEPHTASFVGTGNISNIHLPANWTQTIMFAAQIEAANDAVYDQKVYMRSLQAEIEYEPKYYAKFYSDGAHVATKTVNGGESATPPSVSKTGYRLIGWKSGNTTYQANNLPTSEATDLTFTAVWEKIYYKITLPKKANASCSVTNTTGTYVYPITSVDANTDETWVAHGDSILVKASGFNLKSQNLSVKVNNGTSTIETNGNTQNIQIFSGQITEHKTLSISTVDVSFALNVTKTGSGTVEAPASVLRGNTAQVRAYSDQGYYISSVTVDGVSQTLETEQISWRYTFSDYSAAHSVNIVFTVMQREVTFDVDSHVTVTENGVDVTSGLTVDYGSTHTFTFTVPSGYSLDNVSRGGSTLFSAFKQAQSFEYELANVTSAETIEATETDDLATVSITQSEHGTINGEAGTYIIGKGSLSFTAVPDRFCNLVAWFNESTDATITLPVNGDLSISAEFNLPGYTISCIPYSDEDAERGSVGEDGHEWPYDLTGSAGQYKYIEAFPKQYGNFVSVDVRTDSDQTWRSLSYSNPSTTYASGIQITTQFSSTETKSVSISNLQDNVELRFHFDEKTVSISLGGSGNGKVSYYPHTTEYTSVSTAGYRGTTLNIQAYPNEGYHFSHWKYEWYKDLIDYEIIQVDDKGNNLNPYDFPIPNHEIRIIPVFEKNRYVISVETDNGGTATPTGLATHGTDYTLTITADFGQAVADVILDGASIYNDITLTQRGGYYVLPNVTGPHEFKVTFKPKTYTNDRKLFDYWPPVVQAIREMQEIARIQQPTIDEAWDAASFILENQFIDSASEEGVKMWEKELGIVPASTDTLTQRKARLKLKWVPCSRFTMRWLVNWLRTVCGRDDIDTPTVEDYALLLYLPSTVDWVTICADLERYIPCNLWLDPKIKLNSGEQNILIGFAIGVDIDVTIEGEAPESEEP